MSPRRNRPGSAGAGPGRRDRRRRRGGPPAGNRTGGEGRAGGDGVAPYGLARVEEWPDGDWIVRPVTGAASTKAYRCPGCDHEIARGAPHLVVWRAEDPQALTDRRHWHRPCWVRRPRRPR